MNEQSQQIKTHRSARNSDQARHSPPGDGTQTFSMFEPRQHLYETGQEGTRKAAPEDEIENRFMPFRAKL